MLGAELGLLMLNLIVYVSLRLVNMRGARRGQGSPGRTRSLPSLPSSSPIYDLIYLYFDIFAQWDHQHVLGQCSSAAITNYLVACCEGALVCLLKNKHDFSSFLSPKVFASQPGWVTWEMLPDKLLAGEVT